MGAMLSRTTWMGAAALTALGCTTEEDLRNLVPGGDGGNGQGGATASSSTTVAVSSSLAVTTSTGQGGSSFDCDPPADPGSIYEHAGTPFYPPFEPISMCQYRGNVMLIVNTAAL
jgi:hypothetical protein